MAKIILATSSPYRQEAFGFLGLDFVAEGSDVREDFEDRPGDPEGLVLQLARLKAEAVARNHREGIVIGFDSVGWFEGSVLEKAKTRKEAFQRLKSLSGKGFQFLTGIHMINLASGRVLSRAVRTDITMRGLSEQEINRYLDKDPNFMSYAHGFDSQRHYSSSFAKRVEGSYNNFTWGLPLEEIVEMLIELGFEM